MGSYDKEKMFNTLTQFAIPSLTISAQILLSLKFPQWSLVINFLAQPFWLYSGWKAYKKAGQSGILINSILFPS